MKVWISESTVHEVTAAPTQSFFSIPVEMDDKLAEQVVKFEKDKLLVRKFLRGYASITQAKIQDPATLEVPLCLQDEARKEPVPKKKDTGAASKKKSQIKRRKIQSGTSTSPPTDA